MPNSASLQPYSASLYTTHKLRSDAGNSTLHCFCVPDVDNPRFVALIKKKVVGHELCSGDLVYVESKISGVT